MTSPRINITETHEEHSDMYDCTPDHRRERARELTIEVGRKGEAERTEVIITELERDDPTTMYCAVNFSTVLHIHADESIATNASARQLETLIQTLQLARDVAIAEGMIEPAR